MRYFPTLQNIKVQWLAISVLVSIAAPAYSEVLAGPDADVPEVIAPPWELYDTDEDGYISAEEAAAQKMSPRTFESLDIDRDGRLNQEEFTKAPPIELE